MTVLCWNTTWISVHSSTAVSLIPSSTLGYFLIEGLKNNNNNSSSSSSSSSSSRLLVVVGVVVVVIVN